MADVNAVPFPEFNFISLLILAFYYSTTDESVATKSATYSMTAKLYSKQSSRSSDIKLEGTGNSEYILG